MVELLGINLLAALIVVVLAWNPVGEVRLAVPVAMLHFGMGPYQAFVWALLGSLLVAPTLWWLLPRAESVARRSAVLARTLDRIYAKTRRAHSKRVERLEEMAIALIIAVPVPLSGAWTGLVVGHLFGLKRRQVAGPYYVGIVGATALAVALVHGGKLAFPFFYNP